MKPLDPEPRLPVGLTYNYRRDPYYPDSDCNSSFIPPPCRTLENVAEVHAVHQPNPGLSARDLSTSHAAPEDNYLTTATHSTSAAKCRLSAHITER